MTGLLDQTSPTFFTFFVDFLNCKNLLALHDLSTYGSQMKLCASPSYVRLYNHSMNFLYLMIHWKTIPMIVPLLFFLSGLLMVSISMKLVLDICFLIPDGSCFMELNVHAHLLKLIVKISIDPLLHFLLLLCCIK